MKHSANKNVRWPKLRFTNSVPYKYYIIALSTRNTKKKFTVKHKK